MLIISTGWKLISSIEKKHSWHRRNLRRLHLSENLEMKIFPNILARLNNLRSNITGSRPKHGKRAAKKRNQRISNLRNRSRKTRMKKNLPVFILICSLHSGRFQELTCFGTAYVKISRCLTEKKSENISPQNQKTKTPGFVSPVTRVLTIRQSNGTRQLADRFGTEGLKMPPTFYEYVSQTNGIWCCDPCTTKQKNLIKEVATTTERTKKKPDLNKTVSSLKIFMDDFYYFMDRTKLKSQAAS